MNENPSSDHQKRLFLVIGLSMVVLFGWQLFATKMGWVKVRRGHMALLPKGAAYQFRNNGTPGVLLVQTILGENTVEKWAEICQTK